jgi:symplekin
METLARMLYSSQDVDLLSAMLNSWVNLVKQRPSTFPFVITTLRSWTPAALANLPASSIKSVEKAVRILLVHLSRLPTSTQYLGQINEALGLQSIRMDKAAAEEKKRKADNRKRPSSGSNEPTDNKRIKLETAEPAPTPVPNNATFLSAFDFTSLPAQLITNLIVANLEAFTEPQLIAMVNAYRQSRGLAMPADVTAVSAKAAPVPTAPTIVAPKPAIPTGPRRMVQAVESSITQVQQPPAAATPPVKAEPVDPLQMDIDEEELEYEPERLNEEVRLLLLNLCFPITLVFLLIIYSSISSLVLQNPNVPLYPLSTTYPLSNSNYPRRETSPKTIETRLCRRQYRGYGTGPRSCALLARESRLNRHWRAETLQQRCGCSCSCG